MLFQWRFKPKRSIKKNITIFREFSEKWQNAPLDFSKSYAERKTADPAEIENFIEKMFPLIESAMSQYGDEELEGGQGKKEIAENDGELTLPQDICKELNIQSTKIVSTDIGKNDPSIIGIHFLANSNGNSSFSIIALFSMLSHQLICQCEWRKSLITCFALCPADEMLIVAGNNEGEVFLFDLNQGKQASREPINIFFTGHKAAIAAITIRSSLSNPYSGLAASIDFSGTICFWRIDPVTAGADMIPSIDEIILGEYKLQMLECTDLSRQYFLSDALPKSIQIDPRDTNSYYT